MRRSSISWQQIPLALHLVYRDWRYLFSALGTGLLSAIVLGWAVQLVTYFPGSSLFWDVTPLRLVQVLVVAGSLGLLIPMQIYVLRKRHQRPKPASAGEQRRALTGWATVRQSGLTVLSSAVGLSLGVACLVCCAPLLIPAGLAFLGMSGTAILSLNGSLVQWSGWLFLASLILSVLTLLLVAHNVTAVCGLMVGQARKDSPLRDMTREGSATESANAQEV